MYECQVEHLVRLAQSAGWLDYAQARSKELESDKTGLFIGIGAAIAARLKARNTDALTSTKPD